MTKKVFVLAACLMLLVSGVAYSENVTMNCMQDFVAKVYEDYAAGSFSDVHAVMYPTIHENVTEEEYVQFQQHHFDRLNLELTEIEVGEVIENPRFGRSLRDLLPEDNSLRVYGVEISYRASFVSGVRMNQSTSKTVYIALANAGTHKESLYLLWDPSSMEEEETEDDSN